ncbi:hypothetical protein TNCV_4387821 [Trichonephila clavipes]|nr:hypothetical protein TNCV_4387821 [Trichonephila clavipes]
MLIYELPASSLKCRAQPNVIRRSFEPHAQMNYHRTILEPHMAYLHLTRFTYRPKSDLGGKSSTEETSAHHSRHETCVQTILSYRWPLCGFRCPRDTWADSRCPRATCLDSRCPTATCADSTTTCADSRCLRTCADSTCPTIICADSVSQVPEHCAYSVSQVPEPPVQQMFQEHVKIPVSQVPQSPVQIPLVQKIPDVPEHVQIPVSQVQQPSGADSTCIRTCAVLHVFQNQQIPVSQVPQSPVQRVSQNLWKLLSPRAMTHFWTLWSRQMHSTSSCRSDTKNSSCFIRYLYF